MAKASRAKLIHQRKTRKTKKLNGGSSKKVKGIVDRRMITPGCKFTGEVVEALAYYICQRLASRKYEHVKFYVSGANVAGEGELKIMKYIRSMSEGAREKDVFALVGSDADLVLLAVASRVSKISILNALSPTSAKMVASVPTRRGNGGNGPKNSNQGNQAYQSSKRDLFIEIEIDKLVREFSQLVPGTDARDVGLDFVALSIMSGNDYLPKVPNYFVQQYWEHYVKARKSAQWRDEYLIDPKTARLNLNFLDSLLAHSPARPIASPPIHHERKLIRLRKLRADLASGIINREDIIKQYTIIPAGATSGLNASSALDEHKEMLRGILSELGEEEGEGETTKNNFAEDDDYDDDDAKEFAEDEDMLTASSGNLMIGSEERATSAMRLDSHSSSSLHHHHSQNSTITTEFTKSNGDEQKTVPPIQIRDPIELFLEIKSKDTWSEYDADDHASQYLYGLEWVMASYLRGECVSYDWFYPYSSAPGPKELHIWIQKAKADPSIIKSLPPRMMNDEGGRMRREEDLKIENATEEDLSAKKSGKTTRTTRRSDTSPVQPWMFAMMLLDASTYHFLSPSIPTHTVTHGSYVHEVHDPGYFFGYIDSVKMEEEMSEWDVSEMSELDRAYSHLGHICLYQRSYERGAAHYYVPKSPFDGEAEPLRASFAKFAIPDLTLHHSLSPLPHRSHSRDSHRSHPTSDPRYLSQHAQRQQTSGSHSHASRAPHAPPSSSHSHQNHYRPSPQPNLPQTSHVASQQGPGARTHSSLPDSRAHSHSPGPRPSKGKRDARGEHKDPTSSSTGSHHGQRDTSLHSSSLTPHSNASLTSSTNANQRSTLNSTKKVDVGSLFASGQSNQSQPSPHFSPNSLGPPLPPSFGQHNMMIDPSIMYPMPFTPMDPLATTMQSTPHSVSLSATSPLLPLPSIHTLPFPQSFPSAYPNQPTAAPSGGPPLNPQHQLHFPSPSSSSSLPTFPSSPNQQHQLHQQQSQQKDPQHPQQGINPFR